MPIQCAGGYELHTEQWLPDGPIKSVVVIAHGMGEHSGRYQHVGGDLAQAGYAVHALDDYGHGHSPGRRAYFDDLDQPIRDLAQFVDSIRAEHPNRPLWLYGHSMGALIALLVALDHQDMLSGLIVTGNTLDLHTQYPDFVIPLVAWLDRLVPWLPVMPFAAGKLSRDPAVVKAYKTDPLVYHGLVRIRMAHFLLVQSARARSRVCELKLPLLIMHGWQDSICPYSGSRLLYDKATSKDRQLKIYGPAYHEIHQEPEQMVVFDDIVAWLNERS